MKDGWQGVILSRSIAAPIAEARLRLHGPRIVEPRQARLRTKRCGHASYTHCPLLCVCSAVSSEIKVYQLVAVVATGGSEQGRAHRALGCWMMLGAAVPHSCSQCVQRNERRCGCVLLPSAHIPDTTKVQALRRSQSILTKVRDCPVGQLFSSCCSQLGMLSSRALQKQADRETRYALLITPACAYSIQWLPSLASPLRLHRAKATHPPKQTNTEPPAPIYQTAHDRVNA
ncbi:hypothetical protein P171DRAFT_115363 [Karstenula rhodostoma CBS 690.94]|uniref:Uncharacterized protein n=1 Tax=Karstenula rhodostoma CBS 690.94 TaxID=1392251 RepID=A0A9P4P9T0_9PLEO|nr:hypothetical protein P171DRAFT_115363 [Karstenula rhodostoma CBS 690.94]